MTLACQVILQPPQLVLSHISHRIHLHAVVQADEVDALVVKAVPAVAGSAFAEALLVLHAIVDKVVLTRNIEHLALDTLNHLRSRIELCRLRVLRDVAGVQHEVRSLRPAGAVLARSIAFFSVPVTSGFAPLLNPIWQSLICTNEKSATASVLPATEPPVAASSFEVGTPATIDQSNPVPAHAMHPRKLRRSIPSPPPPFADPAAS